LRIPGDVLGRTAVPDPFTRGRGPDLPGAQADEDDISMLWLTDQSQTQSSAATLVLASNENMFRQGEIFAGPPSPCNSMIRSPTPALRSSSSLRMLGLFIRADWQGFRAWRLCLRRSRRSADCIESEVQGHHLQRSSRDAAGRSHHPESTGVGPEPAERSRVRAHRSAP
jgi:hypothetical protein